MTALLLRFVVSLSLLLLTAPGAAALVLVKPPERLQGTGKDMELREGVAYVATSAGLEIYDASSPRSGYRRLALFPGAARAVALSAGRAALLGASRVHILDVSNPALPVELGSFQAPALAVDLEFVGNLVYVAESLLGLHIYDVGDPTAPVELGALSIVPYAGYDAAIAVADGIAYLNSAGGAAIVDVHDPTHPALLTRLQNSARIEFGVDVKVRQGLLYLPDASFGPPFTARSGVRILDVSNPAVPIDVGFAEVFFVTEIELSGDLLFAHDLNGVWLFDISNPIQPQQIGEFAFGGSTNRNGGVEVADGFAHLLGGAAVGIIDLALPEFPARSFDEGSYDALEPSGGLVYALGDRSFDIFEMTPPLAPVRIGGTGVPSADMNDLEVIGDFAYAADFFSALHIYDVSDPTQPRLVGSAPYPAWALKHSGNLLYAGSAFAAVDVLDVSDPLHPVPVGSIDLYDELFRLWDIDAVGDLLYVTGILGFRVVDTSDPSAPRVIGGVDVLGSSAFAAAIAGDVLYLVLDGRQGVGMYDVSDPTSPVEIGALYRPSGVHDFVDAEVEGTRLYLSDGTVRVHDVSEPTAPVLLGGAQGAGRMVVADGVVYTALPYYFHAIDFGPEYQPPRDVEIDLSPRDPHNRVVITQPGSALVALFGSADFDVLDVDLASLTFGPAGAPARTSVRVRMGGDPYKDLSVIFWVPDAGIAIGDTEVCLSGRTRDGARFRGCDAIQPLAACGDGYAAALVTPLLLPLRRAVRRVRPARPLA